MGFFPILGTPPFIPRSPDKKNPASKALLHKASSLKASACLLVGHLFFFFSVFGVFLAFRICLVERRLIFFLQRKNYILFGKCVNLVCFCGYTSSRFYIHIYISNKLSYKRRFLDQQPFIRMVTDINQLDEISTSHGAFWVEVYTLKKAVIIRRENHPTCMKPVGNNVINYQTSTGEHRTSEPSTNEANIVIFTFFFR